MGLFAFNRARAAKKKKKAEVGVEPVAHEDSAPSQEAPEPEVEAIAEEVAVESAPAVEAEKTAPSRRQNRRSNS